MKKVILSLSLVLWVVFGYGQLDIVKRTITLDSLNARINNIYMNSPVYFQDTLLKDYILFYAASPSLSFGNNDQIPYMNISGSDFNYSDNLKFNDTTLLIGFGTENLFIGKNAGKKITSGTYNTSLGVNTARVLTTATSNTFIGSRTGYNVTNGNQNVFIGSNAGFDNITGDQNVCVGVSAGENILGSRNVSLGYQAGYTNTGSLNIFLGYQAGYNETGSNKLYIDNSNTSNPLIYGEFDNSKIRFNADTTTFVGHVVVDSNFYVYGRSIHEKYEIAAHVPYDSTLTTAATTTWTFLGDGSSSKFVNTYADGFGFDGDTIYFIQSPTDFRDSVEFRLDWASASSATNNAITLFYGVFIKHIGDATYTEYEPLTHENKMQTSGDLYSWGSGTYPIFLKDGDKVQIRLKTAATSTTITTQRFTTYLREQ